MRKIIALALALMLVLTMAACGGESTPETTAPAAQNTPTTPDAASWKYNVQGIDIMMHAPAAPILETLGEPVRSGQDLLLRRLLPADLPHGRQRLRLLPVAG